MDSLEPIPLSREDLRERLSAALAKVEDPRELIGRYVPRDARNWAAEYGLAVRETSFAPAGRLYVVGAVPVENVLIP